MRNEFTTRYRGHAARRVAVEFKPKLIGLIDADREAHGLPHESRNLRLIGDADKAREVMRLGSDSPAIRITSAAPVLRLVQGGRD